MESQQQAPGNAEELREKAELQRSYVVLLHALCNNSMAVALSRLSLTTLEPCMQVSQLYSCSIQIVQTKFHCSFLQYYSRSFWYFF